MIRTLIVTVALFGLAATAQASAAPTAVPQSTTATSDTVYVFPLRGEEKTDRASILAAFDAVQPGGTVQFAPGTYLAGELIPIEAQRITMQGHSQGTTLLGQKPAGVAAEPGRSDGATGVGAGGGEPSQPSRMVQSCDSGCRSAEAS